MKSIYTWQLFGLNNYQYEGKSIGFIESSISVALKIAFRFEIFYPQAIKLFLNRKLKEYKDKGTLTDYKVKTNRLGKYHYFLEMDLFLDKIKGGDKNSR